jgi:CheY-like chemotaxis protein
MASADKRGSGVTEPVVIAMIEDDEGHAHLIEKNLRRAGVNNEIVPLRDGASAIAFLFGPNGTGLVNQSRHLLILLDLNLPDMSGIDILRRLKENEHLKISPVIVLTTTDDRVEIQRCYDLGCNVYITKPVDYEKFAHAIQQLGLFVSVIQVPKTI